MTAPAVKTGHDKPKCGAKKHQGNGGPCTRPAGWGTNHAGTGRCKLHGGGTRNHKYNAAQQQARQAFGKLTDVSTPVADPLSELAKLAGDVIAWKDFLAGRISEMEQLAYSGFAGEQIKGEIQLFGQALDRCNTVLSSIARLNIDDRLARITEAQATMVLKAFDHALRAAEVPERKRASALREGVKHLRITA